LLMVARAQSGGVRRRTAGTVFRAVAAFIRPISSLMGLLEILAAVAMLRVVPFEFVPRLTLELEQVPIERTRILI
jgi:hypothetical protein